jgi:hypothetical protein
MEEMRAGGPAAMEKYAGDPGRILQSNLNSYATQYTS